MQVLNPAMLAARAAELVVIDVRSDAAFAAGHLRGAGHVPAGEIRARRSELPPRETQILIVAEDAERAAAAAQGLEELGYVHVAWLDCAIADLPGGLEDRQPAARLWRPSPFLERVLPMLPPPSPSLRVIDLAAGAGREAVFLAMRGYQVEAWDHDPDALARARSLAGRHGVAVETVVRDLERRDPELPVGAHGLVLVFRFLHRPLMPRIAAAVAPGGFVVYETFLKGQERFGRPSHPRFLLDKGELPRCFAELEVEIYEESRPEGGPWLARLLARRA